MGGDACTAKATKEVSTTPYCCTTTLRLRLSDPWLRWGEQPLVSRGWKSALTRSAQQLVRDHLVTVRILAQRRELVVSKNAVQIQCLPGLPCPVELMSKLLQRHALNRLLHGTVVTMFGRDDSSAIVPGPGPYILIDEALFAVGPRRASGPCCWPGPAQTLGRGEPFG